MKGTRKKAAGGQYDVQITFALRFEWDQLQVEAQDADYIDELSIALAAEAAVQRRQRSKQ